MKTAVHFGVNRLGRGGVAAALQQAGYAVTLVGSDEAMIAELKRTQAYHVVTTPAAAATPQTVAVTALNSRNDAEQVVTAVANAAVITTTVQYKELSYVAPLLALGLMQRLQAGNHAPLTIIASDVDGCSFRFLRAEMFKHIKSNLKEQIDQLVSFPPSLLDATVVAFTQPNDAYAVYCNHDCQWVIATDAAKLPAPIAALPQVTANVAIQPEWERKTYSADLALALLAYLGQNHGYATLADACRDEDIMQQVTGSLAEVKHLLCSKWNYSPAEITTYQRRVLARFADPDMLLPLAPLVAAPLDHLRYDERLVRPLRELVHRNLPHQHLLAAVAQVYRFQEPTTPQSITLKQMLQSQNLTTVITQTTGLAATDPLVAKLRAEIK